MCVHFGGDADAGFSALLGGEGGCECAESEEIGYCWCFVKFRNSPRGKDRL